MCCPYNDECDSARTYAGQEAMAMPQGTICCPCGCEPEDYVPPKKNADNEYNVNAAYDNEYKVNAAFSDENIVERKRSIVLNGIQTIKHIAYLDYDYAGGFFTGSLNGENITSRKRDEEKHNTCEKLIFTFRNSNLSLTEKKNLYRQLLNSISNHNSLNLFLSLQTIILSNSVGLSVPDAVIEDVIVKEAKNIINVILLNATYSEEFNNYNYSEAFNFGYYFITLNLQLMRSYVFARCFADIQTIYGPSYFPKYHTGQL